MFLASITRKNTVGVNPTSATKTLKTKKEDAMNWKQKFTQDVEDSGRFTVTSKRTGKRYYVEPIGDPHVEWGSVDPSSKKMMVKKGWKKNKGSIEHDESLITKENGFEKIHSLKAGESPLAYIDRIDSQYPDKES